jgi:hypothetical protein
MAGGKFLHSSNDRIMTQVYTLAHLSGIEAIETIDKEYVLLEANTRVKRALGGHCCVKSAWGN